MLLLHNVRMSERANWKLASKHATKSECNKPPPLLVCHNNTCKLQCSTPMVHNNLVSFHREDEVCHSLHKLVCQSQVLRVVDLANSPLVSLPNKPDVAHQLV